jgi:hypothetical protein
VKAGTVFISFTDQQLYALDAQTGRWRWHFLAGATYTTLGVQTPADPAAPGPAGTRYFAQSRHTLDGAFLAFWQCYGGLPVFGYPLSERFALVLVRDTVVTLPLGRTLTAGRRFPPAEPFRSTGSRRYIGLE